MDPAEEVSPITARAVRVRVSLPNGPATGRTAA
jgi:hypothetical protein